MKTQIRNSLRTTLQFFVLLHFAACSDKKQEIGLGEMLDAPKIIGIELPPQPFVESAFAIRQIVAAHLANSEKPGTLTLAERLRVVLTTLREGEHVVTKSPMSIRGYLQEFATKWNVAILLNNDTIMIVELYDKDRFQHQIAILPNLAKKQK